MQDRPSLDELLASAEDFLLREALPAMPDARLRFRARIAANVLAVARRELALEEANLRAEHARLRELSGDAAAGAPLAAPELRAAVGELTRRLAERIQSGELSAAPRDAVWEHVRRSLVEKLQVANPAFLERLEKAGAAE
jgi:hypothetical protein